MCRVFLLFILLNFFIITKSEMKMMLVWGIPESHANAIINESLTWNGCLASCYYNAECVMAWQLNSSCLIYNYYSMSKVVKASSENGSVVGFKVNSPDSQCPVGTNPPTFNNQSATGMLYVNKYPPYWPLYVKYTIRLDQDTWKFSYSVNRSCRGTFEHVIEHQDGSGICVNYWSANNDGSFDHARGVELCKNNTAYLGGLVEKEDFAWFEKIGQELRPKLATRDTFARIDGVRTTQCRSNPKTAACMSPKGFKFTGPPVPHFNNYKWVTDASAMATKDDNCLVMVFKGTGAVKVDVRGCSFDTTPLKTRLIYCSNKAWIYDSFDYD